LRGKNNHHWQKRNEESGREGKERDEENLQNEEKKEKHFDPFPLRGYFPVKHL
jgi:hypothetical protein